jgi:hypothetical protein
MLTLPRILSGSHIKFFRDGAAFTVPSSGTAGRSVKPGAADTGWIDLGIIEDATATPEREEREVYAPVPGKRVLFDVLETSNQLNLQFTCSELSPLVLEAVFDTANLTAASTQFNPLEGATRKGWLKIQIYDSRQVLVSTVDMYVHLVAGALSLNGEIARVEMTARLLHSTLNTGSLTTT